jgi:alanyl-tRNA synthetase
VIDIAEFDRSACGGTHVRTTGEIGAVLITGIERAKKQSRIQFICGDRVVRYGRLANRTLESISQTISAPPLETAAGVRALWDENQQNRKRLEDLESQLMDHEAAQYPVENGLAIGAFKDRGIEKVKLLAAKVCSRPGIVALFADQSDQLRVVFARSTDSSVDVAALLKQTLGRFGGRGGGRPNMAQGGGLTGTADEVLGFAKEHCWK